jgi:hypothetical protein
MKKFIKLTSVIISVTIIVLTCYCQVFAQSETETINIPIIQTTDGVSQQDLQNAIDSATEEYQIYSGTVRSGYILIKPYIIRSGDTSSCELYLSWECPNYLCSAIAFDNYTIKNTSALFPIVYANIGGSYLPCQTASQGTVRVLNITIPAYETTVRAEATGLKAEIVGEGWISTISVPGNVGIN